LLCELLALDRSRASAPITGVALSSGFVRGPIRARNARLSRRASFCQHVLQTLGLEGRPAACPLLGLQRNLEKLHASTLRGIGETSSSPAARKSHAECNYPFNVHITSSPVAPKPHLLQRP